MQIVSIDEIRDITQRGSSTEKLIHTINTKIKQAALEGSCAVPIVLFNISNADALVLHNMLTTAGYSVVPSANTLNDILNTTAQRAITQLLGLHLIISWRQNE